MALTRLGWSNVAATSGSELFVTHQGMLERHAGRMLYQGDRRELIGWSHQMEPEKGAPGARTVIDTRPRQGLHRIEEGRHGTGIVDSSKDRKIGGVTCYR